MRAGPTPWWFEDFGEGQVFTTPRRTVTDADVVFFAGWSWDTNPVHTDAVGAADGRFGEPIAHGMLGAAIAMGLAARLGVFEHCSVALLGIDGWRFRAPLRIGATVAADVTIVGTRLTSSGTTGVLARHFRLLETAGPGAGDTLLQEGRIDLLVRARPEEPR